MKARDWIVFCDGSIKSEPYGFKCLRCGKNDKLPARIPVKAFIAWGKSFSNVHSQCVAQELKR